MNTDLTILKRRLSEDTGRTLSPYWASKINDLIGEVEKLRKTEAQERAAVLRLLRSYETTDALNAAVLIESGKHRRGE